MRKKSGISTEIERANHELEKYLQNNQEIRSELTNMILGYRYREPTIIIYEGERHAREFERTIPRDR